MSEGKREMVVMEEETSTPQDGDSKSKRKMKTAFQLELLEKTYAGLMKSLSYIYLFIYFVLRAFIYL